MASDSVYFAPKRVAEEANYLRVNTEKRKEHSKSQDRELTVKPARLMELRVWEENGLKCPGASAVSMFTKYDLRTLFNQFYRGGQSFEISNYMFQPNVFMDLNSEPICIGAQAC